MIFSRLVTLTGVGGVGKTRLALELGHELCDSFPDGVWLVDLSTLNDPGLLADTMVTELGWRDEPGRWAVPMLADRLTGRRLLILDNCERLIDAVAVLVTTLLRVLPELHVLVTSRQALQLPGERIYLVNPLPVPSGSQHSVEAVREIDAVRLFVDRGSDVVAGFAVTADNAGVIARLCMRLEGLPLAIELAAARLRVLSVEQLLDRLDDHYRVLSGVSSAVQPRHQSLRASVDWSFELCSALEQLLWVRLTVFVGGFDLDAVEAVCCDAQIRRDQVLDVIAGLVGKSILLCDGLAGRVRYRLLDTLLQYGRQRLTFKRAGAIARRHRDYYLGLAEGVVDRWWGDGGNVWLVRLRADHANLRAALTTAVGDPRSWRRSLRASVALVYYWLATGSASEGRRWLEKFLHIETAPSAERARALGAWACLTILQGDLGRARSILARAWEIGHEIHDDGVLAVTTLVAGVAALQDGDTGVAEHAFGDAHRIHLGLNDEPAAAFALLCRTLAFSHAGDGGRALDAQAEFRRMCGRRQAPLAAAYADWVLGVELWRRGERVRAKDLARDTIRETWPAGDQLGCALGMALVAWCETDMGHHRRAARLLGAVEHVWRTLGIPSSGLGHLGSYHLRCRKDSRSSLGERVFDAEFSAGGKLSIDEVVAELLGMPLSQRPAVSEPPIQHPLTPRELEVASLVAQGLSNKVVAAELVISRRTVDTHVEHILSKMGFSSRTQIATWMTERKGEWTAAPPDPGRPG